jgi:hypothetical protein
MKNEDTFLLSIICVFLGGMMFGAYLVMVYSRCA